MANLLCRLFGHRPEFGYGNREGRGYFRVHLWGIDGIGRQHAYLTCKCERCGVDYTVGNIHIPWAELLKQADPYNKRR